MKYNITRKYSLEVRGANRFEILDLGAEDIENKEDVLKTLQELDKVAKDYCEQFSTPDSKPETTDPNAEMQAIKDLP